MSKNNFLRIFNRCNVKRSSSTNSRQELKSWKQIPGPSSLPILGQAHNYLPGGFLHKFTGYRLQQELYTRYGPIVKVDGNFGGPPMIYVFDSDGAAQVMRGENTLPNRPLMGTLVYYRKVYKRQKKNQTNPVTGIFSDQGEVWKEFRTVINPIFLNPKVIQSYESMLDDVAQDMIKRLRSLRDKNNIIQSKFDYEINLWALESIAAVGLGDRINCLDIKQADDLRAVNLIKAIRNFFILTDELDFFPSLWPYYPTRKFKQMMQTYEDIDEICYSYVNQSIEKLKRNELIYKGNGFLEKLLAVDKYYAELTVADMLFGGVDTGTNTLLATMYLLAKHPDIQNKLREEVMSKSGKTFLKACFKETMRVMPAITGTLRKTTKEYNILGYRLPKDTIILFGHQLLCSMERHYPRASEYIPERWLVGKDDPLYYGNAQPFTYNPFGFGVRSCIGRRIIELEMEIFLARLIENFHIGWDGPPPNIKYTFVNAIKEPFYFTLKDV